MSADKAALTLAACGLAMLAPLAGCRPPAPAAAPAPPRRPSVKVDPCAERLHDICGLLLMYYSLHRSLPPSPADLKALGADEAPPLECPISGKPYRYDPEGMEIEGQDGRLVLYDAQACHSGMRWGIFCKPGAGGTVLSTRVILVPDRGVVRAESAHRRSGRPTSRPSR